MGWQPIDTNKGWMMRKRTTSGKWKYRKLSVKKLGRSTLNPANRRR